MVLSRSYPHSGRPRNPHRYGREHVAGGYEIWLAHSEWGKITVRRFPQAPAFILPVMDDREKRIADLQEHLDAMTPDEREEVRTFLARFDQQVERKTQQLLYELQDPARVSEQDLQMRDRLIAGFVPLIDDAGALIYRKREDLTLEDTRRFGAYLDADRERREREIGGLDQESEN